MQANLITAGSIRCGGRLAAVGRMLVTAGAPLDSTANAGEGRSQLGWSGLLVFRSQWTRGLAFIGAPKPSRGRTGTKAPSLRVPTAVTATCGRLRAGQLASDSVRAVGLLRISRPRYAQLGGSGGWRDPSYLDLGGGPTTNIIGYFRPIGPSAQSVWGQRRILQQSSQHATAVCGRPLRAHGA